MDYSKILNFVKNNKFSKRKILVIGDIMLDEFCYGFANRISPEAPVPVFEPNSSKYMLGGAGNSALNLRTLGANVDIIGLIGNDECAKTINELLEKLKIKNRLVSDEFPTTHKKRFVASNTHLLRKDIEKIRNIENGEVERMILDEIDSVQNVDAIIISDYAKGVITKTIVDHLKTKNIPIYVDSKPERYNLFKDVQLLKPNLRQAMMALGIQRDELKVEEIALSLSKKYNSNIFLTLGEQGSLICELDSGKTNRIQIFDKKKLKDVSGAGDTALAAFVLASLEKDLLFSAEFANICSGMVVSKSGTASTSLDELEVELINGN